jgi:hypothetical protein
MIASKIRYLKKSSLNVGLYCMAQHRAKYNDALGNQLALAPSLQTSA